MVKSNLCHVSSESTTDLRLLYACQDAFARTGVVQVYITSFKHAPAKFNRYNRPNMVVFANAPNRLDTYHHHSAYSGDRVSVLTLFGGKDESFKYFQGKLLFKEY